MNSVLRRGIFACVVLCSGQTYIHAAVSKAESIYVDTSQPMNDFVKAHGSLAQVPTGHEASGNGSTTIHRTFGIPSILIYSPTGELVYFGSNDNEEHLQKNFAMLEGLPASAQNLPSIPDMPTLAEMLDIVPAFKSLKGKILGDGHYVVYVVTMAFGQTDRKSVV